MGTILVAANAEERDFLETALGGTGHRFLWCGNWRQAEQALCEDLDAVLCSAHFDDGRLFDLMEAARSHAASRQAALYGIVIHARHFSDNFLQGLRSAAGLFGAQGVLDLAGLRRDCGDQEATEMLRTAIDGIVAASQRKRRRHRRPAPAAVTA